MKKRLISLALVLTMLLPLLASCSESEQNSDKAAENTDAVTADNTEVAVEEDADDSRASVKDSLPELDYNGKTFTVFYSNGFGWADFIEGPEELTGEVVKDSVFNANKAVADRLDIDLQYTHDDKGDWSTIGSIITTMIMSGDPQNDILMGDQYGIVQLVTKGYFMNCDELPYFDFSGPWWNNNFIENLCIGKDKKFLLSGEYNLTVLCQIFMLYFNKVLYENSFGDPNNLYNTVIEGGWTLDKMSQLATDGYIDKNGNGQVDDGDQYGFVTYQTYSSVDPFMYCGDVQYYTRDEDGYITINMEQERAVTLTEKVVNLFWQKGTNTATGASFLDGNILFLGGLLRSAEGFREMEDDYGFLPIPKLDEEQANYNTLVGDCNLLYAVPVTTLNSDMAGAVLEALNSETYRTVTPAWYEVALKVKYSRDNITAQIIDIIRDSVNTSFIFAYSPLLANVGQVMRDLVTGNNTDYASKVKSTKKVADKMMGRLIEAFENGD